MATFSRLRRLAILGCGLMLIHAHAASEGQTAPAPGATFRIAGRVVSASGGNPLARARVSIVEAHNSQSLQWTITSEDGRFEFKQLGPGKYGLQGAKRGFITASYDAHEQYSTAIVTGVGLDTEHLVLRLAPSAVISGMVLDESGDPVRRATVTLYREDRRLGMGRIIRVRAVSTDDQGAYEFIGLDTGSYFISVVATPWYAVHPLTTPRPGTEDLPPPDRSLDVAYPITYYGDATEPDDASPIPVRGGDRLQADVHLAPVPALHLLFHAPEDAQNGVRVPTFFKPSFDGMEILQAGSMQSVSPGVFEVTGVAAGRYSVRMRGSGRGDQANSEVDLSQDGQELDPSKMEPASNIKATVELLGDATLPPHLGIALRNSKTRIVAWEEANAKSEVEFQGVAPGKYEVLAFAQNKAFSVVRVSTKGNETSGHILNVAAGSSETVSFSLVGSAVDVEGFAKRAGKAAPGVMVVLVPKDPDAHRELFRRDQSDQDGSFSLGDVIAGSYTIVAIENGWDLDWSSPGVIAHYGKHAKPVIVSNHAQSPMHLPDPIEVQPR
jgi:hypothetical protein